METLRADPAALVAAIRSGDPAAEAQLVERYRAGVRSIVRQVVGLRAEVDDLTQDTLLVVLEKARAGEIREPERLAGFVASTARNVGIAFLRKAKRETAWDGKIDETPDPRADAGAAVEAGHAASVVRRVLSGILFGRDREILYRFYVAEEPKDSICESLGLSSLHFNRVLYRARQRFRTALENLPSGRDNSSTGITK